MIEGEKAQSFICKAADGSLNARITERTIWKVPQVPQIQVKRDSITHPTLGNTEPTALDNAKTSTDIIVAGALAVDYCCDYAPLPGSASQASPALHTSNPARISQSLGGVAHNIARAVHFLGANVMLCSVVGDDLAGRIALQQLEAEGVKTFNVSVVDRERTAQYVAVNDARRDLLVAMADMGILERNPKALLSLLEDAIQNEPPKWLVVDGNLEPNGLLDALEIGKKAGVRTAFEPVSTAKAVRLFEPPNRSNISKEYILPVFPNHSLNIVTPNHFELASMHAAAREAGCFERQDWWEVIDAMGIPASGARSRLAMSSTPTLVDQGVPQQSMQLLPFMPCILAKLGPKGVLLTMLLGKEDERLRHGNAAPYIISRSRGEGPASTVGGVYMRLFPPSQVLADADVVSVNGVGDTFLGALITAIVTSGKEVEDLVDFAQGAAALTLKSSEAVSPLLKDFGLRV